MGEVETPVKIEASISADISESTNETLKTLCFPAAEQAGKALGNIIGLFNTLTLPVKLFNEYSEKNYKKYSEKIKDIPNEKIKEVEPEIGIPLMEKLSYTSNNDLAEAYINLLAKASNKDDVELVHPGFINKINSMSPDEIKILEYLKNKKDIEYIIYKVKNNEATNFILSHKLTGLENILQLTSERIQLHIENLISLNILEDKEGAWFSNEEGYNRLIQFYKDEELNYVDKVEKETAYGEGRNLFIEKSYYNVTTIGRTFIKACSNSEARDYKA